MSTDAALGTTIRAWRDRLSPAEAGLPLGRSRRTTGLRREELAELAGLSVDYVVRLEQGRATTPSAQVASALARALRLTTAERDHLFRLARLAPPTSGEISEHIPPHVQRVIARVGDAAVAVFAADWQLIWWNRTWAALFGDPSATPPALRSFARDTFPTGRSTDAPRWHWSATTPDVAATETAVVSDLRRATGRFPHDRRLAALVRELTAGNARFAELWAAGAVSAHRADRKVIEHPAVGPVRVDCDVLTDGDDELKIVVMTAAPDTDDATLLRLAAVAGAQTFAPAATS